MLYTWLPEFKDIFLVITIKEIALISFHFFGTHFCKNTKLALKAQASLIARSGWFLFLITKLITYEHSGLFPQQINPPASDKVRAESSLAWTILTIPSLRNNCKPGIVFIRSTILFHIFHSGFCFLPLESNFDIVFIQFSWHEGSLTHLIAIFEDLSNSLLFFLSPAMGCRGSFQLL